MSEFITSQTETFTMQNGDVIALDRGANTYKIKKENLPAETNAGLIATNAGNIAVNAANITSNQNDIAAIYGDQSDMADALLLVAGIETVVRELNDSEINALNTTPIKIIDLLTSDYIDVMSCTVHYTYNGVAHTGGGDLQIKGTTNIIGTLPATTYTGTANIINKMDFNTGITLDASGVFITTAASDPATGNGLIKVSITFKRVIL